METDAGRVLEWIGKTLGRQKKSNRVRDYGRRIRAGFAIIRQGSEIIVDELIFSIRQIGVGLVKKGERRAECRQHEYQQNVRQNIIAYF